MIRLLVVTAVAAWSVDLLAETIVFGQGAGTFKIEFVHIGDAGNPPDLRPTVAMGAVDYEYFIGKFEVDCLMFSIAKNAGVFDADALGGCGPGDRRIPEHFSEVEAVQFVNWLNTLSGFEPAYKLLDEPPIGLGVQDRVIEWAADDLGYDPANPKRNSLARYFLPTLDEWHKAAYFDPKEGRYRVYATGDELPVAIGTDGGTEPNTAVYGIIRDLAEVDMAGGLSAYGTMAQTGNQAEWEEYLINPNNGRPFFAARSGPEVHELPATESRVNPTNFLPPGVRVVAVGIPEPSSQLLCCWALLALLGARRK